MVCPDCLSGHVRTETPQGRVAKIHGLDTYIADPPAGVPPKGLIIMCPDVFGWEFVNSRLLADKYAAAGDFLVYLPDFMNGPATPAWMTVLPIPCPATILQEGSRVDALADRSAE